MDYIRRGRFSWHDGHKEFLPMQPGDVPATASDCSSLESWVGYQSFTPVSEGVKKFVDWYRNFYSV